ncbi:selenocysteine-specific translation elongation factor [Microtetraspora niveoalba]|uniref:selenocysteine-specific translation elongation factor n=1 Tax=Microtetraspora niveoalba TaxID=46175 RepID=UPI00082E06AD|nr:selenocysteine-specific translation elongation factor [Microtetraspora niveoalba]
MYVIATAGHVDHGKSTLVRALTGMEPDRWAEERRRGMTIDLGYAWTTLDNGARVAFVDVPGHRRFISNTLAGVGPVPAVLLVVAADEGWCRQTSEHVDALDALGVGHGVLAISRADLGYPESAEEEARDHLAGTSLAGIEAVPVSPVAGTGLGELRAALARLTEALPPPPDRPARLWVDRAFSVHGAGTVVTGTLATGSLRVGDELEVVPSGGRVRIRGIETLRTPVGEVRAVARVALNLRAVRPDDIARGSALVVPDQWAVTASMDVRLAVRTERPPAQALLHIGSASVPVRVRPLGADTARLTLAGPVPVRIGERALLRDPGRVGVAAGVVVLDPFPPPLGRRGAARRRSEELAAMTGAPDPAAEVRVRGAVRRAQLVRAGAIGGGDALPARAVETGGWIVDGEMWSRWRDGLAEAVDRWAAAHPMRPGLPPAAAVRELGLPDGALLDALVRQEPGLVADRDGVHRRRMTVTLPPGAQRALDDLLGRLAARPFAAPEAGELAEAGLTEGHLGVAVKRGDLVRLAGGVYLRPDAIDEAVRRLSALPQPFTASEARQALATTRRVALPLFEELDRRGHTRRVDARLRSVNGRG